MGQWEIYRYDAKSCLCGKTGRNGIETKYFHNIYDSLTAKRTDGTELIGSYHYTLEDSLESAFSQAMRYNYAYVAPIY